jgi:hypothetical protein
VRALGPEWTMRAILAFAAVGFVLTAALAWVYDLAPDGIRRTDDLPSAQRAAGLGGRKLEYGPIDEGLYISIGRDDELIWNLADRGTDEIWIARKQ